MPFQRRLLLRPRTSGSVPVVEVDGVEFERTRPARWNARVYGWITVFSFTALGIWSGVLAAHGLPVLGTISAFVLLELALGSWRLLGVTRGPVEDVPLATRVAPLVRQLCGQVRCETPRVSLRGDTVRSAAVVLSRRRTVLVLSRELGHRLTDIELRGILAHEVAHLACGDLTASRRRSRVAYAVAILAYPVTATVVPGVDGFLPLPICMGMAMLGTVLARLSMAPFNRSRETRADAYNAMLCADPAAVGRALLVARALSDKIRAEMFGPPLLRWLLAPVMWRMPTHPPIEQRVARLNASVLVPTFAAPSWSDQRQQPVPSRSR